MIYKSKDYSFVKFKKSHKKDKKYDCILKNKKTGREVTIPFGAKGYEHYKDNVLGLYSKYNHDDKKRRNLYRARHKGEGNLSRKWSPGYLSWHYLW